MMTESDIRVLLAQAEPFRPTVELYDIDEIAGPQIYFYVGRQTPESHGSYSEDYRAYDSLSLPPIRHRWWASNISAEVDAFLARDPAP